MKMAPENTQKGVVQSDELYHVNGVVYIEANLKINELRVLMAIVQHLQGAILFKVRRRVQKGPLPEVFLPERKVVPDLPDVRVVTIPVLDFHFGLNNGKRLRECLEALCHTRIAFPEGRKNDTAGSLIVNNFPGLISGFSFPPYASSVDVYLSDPLIERLLLTEEGYSHYSRSRALSITNKYTVRVYWLICSWRSKGGFCISLDGFRKLLSLGKGYEKASNIVARILEPSKADFESAFPISFQYRFHESDGGTKIVFKIKVPLPETEVRQRKKEAYEFCANLLAKSGIDRSLLLPLLDSLDCEDIRLFVLKVTELCRFLSSSKGIKDHNRYFLSSMQNWLEDWTLRYQDIGG